jgi:hypothetical protein
MVCQEMNITPLCWSRGWRRSSDILSLGNHSLTAFMLRTIEPNSHTMESLFTLGTLVLF